MTDAVAFHKRPLLAAALGLLTGLLVGSRMEAVYCYVTAGLLLVVCVCLFFLKRFRLLPLLLLAVVGLFRIHAAIPAYESLPAYGVGVQGTVSDAPVHQSGRWKLRLRNVTLDGTALKGDLLLTLSADDTDITPQYGDRIALTAAVYPLTRAVNEGSFDTYEYYLGRGIAATAYSSDADTRLRPGTPDIYGALLSFRSRMKSAVYALLGSDYGPLGVGMLLGDTGDIDEDVLQDFRDGGIAHLLAVSGLHVTLLCGALYLLLKRAPWKTRLFAILGFLLLYCVLTGFAPSAIRASVMSGCLFLSQGVLRRYDPPSSLALAFIVLTLWNPFLLFSPSLQLSFGAVGGLLLLSPLITQCLQKLPNILREGLCASCAAQLGILPFTATKFHRFSLFGVFINLLVIPLAALVLLPLILALLLYLVSPALAMPVGQIARVTLVLIRSAASLSARFGTIALPAFSLGATALYAAACVFCSPLCLLQARYKAFLSVLCLLLSVLLVLLPVALRPSEYISVLSVEEGYAIHIHTANEDTLLTDGNPSAEYAALRYAEALCLTYDTHTVSREPQALVELGNTAVRVMENLVQVNGVVYSLKDNGRIRVSLRQGSPFVSAYAILNERVN